MTRMILTIGVALVAGACAAPPSPASIFPAGELVDLSHAYDDRTIYWPTSEKFRLDKVSDGVTPAGYYYAANNLFTAEHGGTHIDAPVHFAAGRPTVDRIPLTRFLGPAVLIDVVAQSEANAEAPGGRRVRHRAAHENQRGKWGTAARDRDTAG